MDLGVIKGSLILNEEWSHTLDHVGEGLESFKKDAEKAFASFGEAGEKITETIGGIVEKITSLGSSGTFLGPLGLGLAGIAAGAVAAGLAVFEGVEKLHSYAEKALDAGVAMLDLSRKTGLSISALGEFKAIAKDTNIPLEAITNSVYKMEVSLGTGADKTVRALSAIGLSAADLKREAPEEAFEKILDGLRSVPDAATQAAAGQAIFSRGFKEVRGLLAVDTEEIVNSFKAMGSGVNLHTAIAAKAVEDSENHISAAFSKLEIRVGSLFLTTWGLALSKFEENLADAFKNSTSSVASWQDFVDKAMMFVINGLASFVSGSAGMLKAWITGWGESVHNLLGYLQYLVDAFTMTADKASKFFGAIGDKAMQRQFTEFAQTSSTAFTALREGSDKAFSTIGSGLSTVQDFANKMHVTQDDLDGYNRKLKEGEDAHKKLTSAVIGDSGALETNKDKIKSLTDELDKQIEKGRKWSGDILDGSVNVGKLGDKQKEVNKVLLDAALAMDAEGRSGDPLYGTLLNLAMQTENWTTFQGKAVDPVKMLTDAAEKQSTAFQNNTLDMLAHMDGLVKLKGHIGDILNLDIVRPFEAYHQETKKVVEDFNNIVTVAGGVSEGFRSIADIAGKGAFGDIANSISTISSALEDVGRSSTKAFEMILDPGKLNDIKLTWMDLASSIVGGVAAVGKATSGTDLKQNVVGGALSGAAAGAGIGITAAMASGAMSGMAGGIWGAAAGAVVGIFIGIFRGRSTRQEMEKVGHEWGVDISAGLADSIKDAKDKFGGQDVAAAVFNLKDIIKEAGGLNQINFDQFMGHLRDVFVMFDRGLFSVNQARQVLDDNFQSFADQVVKSGKIASQSFQEIIQLNAQQGIYAQGILDFVNQRTQAVGTSLATLAQPLLDSIAAWDAAHKSAKDANGELPETDAELKQMAIDQALHAQFAADSAAEIEDLGTIAVGAFGAARQAGMSFVDAVAAIGPGLDSIMQAQQSLGLTEQNNAVASLEHFRQEVDQNQNLVKAAEALNDTMLGLSQIGGLNADTLAAMEDQGQRTFDRLIGSGFTENEALSVMGSYLQDVIDAHIQLGIPIDENTQKMIDLADQYGVLGKNGQSINDILKTGFATLTEAVNKLIETLGGVPSRVNNISDAINHLPNTIPINVDYRISGPTDVPGMDLPQFSEGTQGDYLWFGSGTPVMLHGWEKVTPLGDDQPTSGPWGMTSPPAVAGTPSGGDLYIDQRGAFVGDYASQQRFAKMINDAIMNSYELRNQIGTMRGAR